MSNCNVGSSPQRTGTSRCPREHMYCICTAGSWQWDNIMKRAYIPLITNVSSPYPKIYIKSFFMYLCIMFLFMLNGMARYHIAAAIKI